METNTATKRPAAKINPTTTTQETTMSKTTAQKKNAADLLAQLDSMPTKTLMGLYDQLIKKGAARKNKPALLKALRPVLEQLAGAEPQAEPEPERAAEPAPKAPRKSKVLAVDAPAPAPKAAKSRGAKIAAAQAAVEAPEAKPDGSLAARTKIAEKHTSEIRSRAAVEAAKTRKSIRAKRQDAARAAAVGLGQELVGLLGALRIDAATKAANEATEELDAQVAAEGIDAAAAQAEAMVGEPAAPAQPISLRALIDAALNEAQLAGFAHGRTTASPPAAYADEPHAPARDALYAAAQRAVEEIQGFRRLAEERAAAKPARGPKAPKAPAAPKARDQRLPPVGTVLTRETREKGPCTVVVEAEGIRYAGELYGSLSKAASVHMGVNQNGYAFFAAALAAVGAAA